MQSFKVIGLLAFIGSLSAGAISYIEAPTPQKPTTTPPAPSRPTDDKFPEPPLQVKDTSSENSELNNRYGW